MRRNAVHGRALQRLQIVDLGVRGSSPRGGTNKIKYLHECCVPQKSAAERAPRRRECACSWRSLPKLGSRGQLHLEGRALAERRLYPDATAVHLNDLLGDGQTKAGTALGLG